MTPEVFFCLQNGDNMSTITTENTLGLSFSDRLELSFTHGLGSQVWDEAGREVGGAARRRRDHDPDRARREPLRHDV